MRILITGAAGRLGGRLFDMLSPEHAVTGVDVVAKEGVEALDITDFAAVRSVLHEAKPDIVLHPAAWTDVEGCANDQDRAIAINGLGAGNVAVAAQECGAAIVYISSNEVFDGVSERAYREYDPTNPINPYGYSKLVGEKAVIAANSRHYIVRTAWLFAHGGKNFIQAILGAAASGKRLRVVTNEIANPTYNDDLADAIVALIETERYGVYHLTNAGQCSRYAFARYVLDRAGYADTLIQPITSQEWPRASQPPVYAALANQAGAMMGITLRPWRDAVDAFLEQEGLLK